MNNQEEEKKQESKRGNGPYCPLSKKCGGCRMDGRTYEETIQEKEEHINVLLAPFSGNLYDKRVHLIGMKDPFFYRHKVTATFGRKKDGTVFSGVYEEKSHRICPVTSCRIHHPLADAIIGSIRELCRPFKITIYNEISGNGLLRHVMVRVSHLTGKAMVILVVTDPVFPSKNNFVKELAKRHPEIETIVLNFNPDDTTLVLGPKNTVIYGDGRLTDALCGVTYRLSAGDFYQVNPVMTEKIYQTAIDFAKLKKTDHVLDCYCGIGTIALTAAAKAGSVNGVELNRTAVNDARKNASENKIKNTRFLAADAGEYLEGLAERLAGPAGEENAEPVDVLFMDPPRSGASERFLSAVCSVAPERIVYISCNPETLARDLKLLCKKNYIVKRAVALDQFPFSEHVETVCLLTHNLKRSG